MADPKTRIFVDGFGAMPEGMNSGLSPQLIPADQLAFSNNATCRGGYIKNRPPVKKQTLTFTGGSLTQTGFENSVWQGGCFFISEYGERGFVASIGGRIFFVVNKGSTFEVRDVTPQTNGVDDPNSSGSSIAWLWQSERWMIINDGQSLPIFFDGQISRRSNGPSRLVGVLQVLFNAPAKGASLNITLTAPYTGPFNETIYIGTAIYQVNASVNSYKVTLRNRSEPAGGVIPAGQLLQIQDNLIGLLATPSVPLCSVLGGIPQCVWHLDIAPPQNGTISGITQLIGARLSGQTYFYGTAFGTNAFKAFGNFGTLPVGTPIYNGYVHNSGFAGTTTAPFTIPAVGGTVDVSINSAYNGAIPQTVVINGGVYDIIATNNNPVPSNVINVTNITDTAGTVHTPPQDLTTIPEMQIGRMGAYGMGRNWYSLPDGRSFRATDIVGGSSGSPALKSRDAVLKETENSYLTSGDFIIPGNIGDIRAMWFTAILDTSLGQGPLQVGTSTSIFTCKTPVDRTEWQAVTNPILTQALIGKGPLGQYATLLVNSDTIFRARREFASLVLARRDFDTLGNTPMSREVQRVLDGDDETLAPNCTEIQFNNRVLLGCLAIRGPLGIFHTGTIALNNDPVSTMRNKSQSVYDGLWTGLQAFQMLTGSFDESDRAFAFCYETFTNTIALFEILKTDEADFDNDTGPITMSFESPALFKESKDKGKFEFCDLMDGEMYLADIRGFLFVEVWHRPAFSKCWQPWISFPLCADNTIGVKPKQYRAPIGLGYPNQKECDPTNNIKWARGMNHQIRIQITGSCTFMGALFKAKPADMPTISKIDCKPLCDGVVNTTNCKTCDDQGPCLEFPLVIYNLNAHKSYTNLALEFEVVCPSGQTVSVPVPPGTINYTLPFPPGFEGPYPPLVLGCINGVVVRTPPAFATQEQLDTLVNEMITVCAKAYAEAHVTCADVVPSNVTVYFDVECGVDTTLTYSGDIPGWITIDTDNNRLVGAAGTFTAETSAEATDLAQQNLNDFANAALTAGDLTCVSDVTPASIIQLPAQGVGWDDTFSAACFVNGPGGLTYGFGNFKTFTSPVGDGINWTSIATHTGDFSGPSDVAFGLGLFEITAGGTRIYNSPDAITWGSNFSVSRACTSVAFGNGMFVACGGSFLAKGGSRSTDGLNWTDFNPGMVRARRVTFGNGLFVMVGNNFEIFTSPDGVVWTSRHSGTVGNGLNCACFGNNRFFVGGENGHTLYSDDGMSWTAADFTMGHANETMNTMVADNAGQVIVVGIGNGGGSVDGRIYQSLDNGVTYAFYQQYAGGFKIPRFSYFDASGNKILLGFRVT